MSNYLRGVDISQYNPGQISKLCSYFQSKGTPLDIVQVELTSGSTIELTTSNNQDDPDPQIIKVIKDANDNNLKIGYYAYIYPYKEGWSTVAQQATAFANAYNQVKQELGITPDCKIMLDIENKAFKVAGVTKSSSIGNQMVTEFVNTVNGILGEQEYVVYSSESGITAFFDDIDVSQFGLVISAPPTDECLSMEQITYPTTNPISGFSSNWNGNWTGVQFAFGSDQDYDIYTEDILITNNSLKIGTEVKITSGKNFAPNLIPANEKGVSYTIETINESMCKLSGINEWVDFQNLDLVSVSKPIISSNNSNNSSWTALSLPMKLVLYLATSEGFLSYDNGVSIGYGVDNWQSYCPYSQPISKTEAIQVSLNYLNDTSNGKSNYQVWVQTLENANLPVSELTDYQLIALFDFAYNAGASSLYSLASSIANCGNKNNPPASLFNVKTLIGTPNHYGLELRRSREWQTYCTGNIHFGGNISSNVLPSNYSEIVEAMYIPTVYAAPFV